MTGFWLASFVVLWVVVVALAMVILAMAREIEDMHRRLETMSYYMANYPVKKGTKGTRPTNIEGNKMELEKEVMVPQ